MPSSVTETSEFTANVQVPNDGEDCDSSSLLDNFVQKLTNRTKFLKDAQQNGAWTGKRLLHAPGDGSVNVGVVSGVLIGGKLCSKATATALSLGTLGNNTWYHVYATDDGSGGIAFVIDSVNGPDLSLTWKYVSGAPVTTHRYVGSFRTNGSAAVLPFRMENGNYTWRKSAMSGAWNAIVSGVSAGSWSTLSLAALIAPSARVAIVQVTANGNLTSGTVQLRTKDDTAGYWEIASPNSQTLEIECNGGGALEYQVTGSGPATLDLLVVGFRE